MGYLYYSENKETEFENKIKLEGDAKKNGTLTIEKLRLNDSAVYFCAAYYTQCSQSPLTHTKTSSYKHCVSVARVLLWV